MFKKQKKQQSTGRRPSITPPGNRAVFSYYAKQRVRTDDPVRRFESQNTVRTRVSAKRWLRQLPSLIALLAVVVSLLYCLGLETNPKVLMDAPTPQASLRSRTEYQQGAQKLLNSSVFNRSKVTIDTEAFVRAFMRQFPEVSDASVTLPLIGRRPVISVDTAQPVLLLSTASQLFVLDNRGKAIIDAREAASSIRRNLPLVRDESGLDASTGKVLLPPDEVRFIAQFSAHLAVKKVAVESMTLPAQARELHVRLVGQSYYIKCNVTTDARVAVGTFLAVKDHLQREGIVPSEYIDVRIEERAYYK